MYASARLVIILSLLTQLAGFAKTVVIANYFGAGADLDGYYLALVPPSLIVGLFGGVLQTAFVPVYMELVSQGRHVQAAALRNRLFTFLLLLLTPLGMLLSLYAKQIVGWYVPETETRVITAAARAFPLVVYLVLLNTVADYFALVLNAHKNFRIAALAPLANIALSTLIIVIWPSQEQYALTIGLLAGLLLQLALVGWELRQAGMSMRLAWPVRDVYLLRVASLAAVIAVGVLLANVNLAVDQVMAAMIGEGATSLINYANRFHNLVVQILIMGMGTVLLPHLTALHLAGENAAITRLFVSLSGPVLFMGILVTVAIQLFSVPVIGLLLERGAFKAQDVEAVSSLWFWYSLGLTPMAWGIFLARYFQASRSAKLITMLAFISCLTNISLNLLFIAPFGINGLAMSTSLTYLIVATLYHIAFVRATKFRFGFTLYRQGVAIAMAVLFIFWSCLNNDAIGSSPPLGILAGILLIVVAVPLLRIRQGMKELILHNG